MVLVDSFETVIDVGICLSKRETNVLIFIAHGYTSKHIAFMLHISLRTATTHRASIMVKLDIQNNAGLTRFAFTNDLVRRLESKLLNDR